MSKFRKENKKGAPGINTSSLPDIVFMLLFFFMVATVMRQNTLKVKNELPYADQVEKLDKNVWFRVRVLSGEAPPDAEL